MLRWYNSQNCKKLKDLILLRRSSDDVERYFTKSTFNDETYDNWILETTPYCKKLLNSENGKNGLIQEDSSLQSVFYKNFAGLRNPAHSHNAMRFNGTEYYKGDLSSITNKNLEFEFYFDRDVSVATPKFFEIKLGDSDYTITVRFWENYRLYIFISNSETDYYLSTSVFGFSFKVRFTIDTLNDLITLYTTVYNGAYLSNQESSTTLPEDFSFGNLGNLTIGGLLNEETGILSSGLVGYFGGLKISDLNTEEVLADYRLE